MEDSLDTSWIQQEDKIESIQNHYIREPMESINTYFIYINSNDSIEKIICEKEPCIILGPENKVGFNKERLLQIIQNKKYRTSSNAYKVLSSKSHGNKKYGLKKYLLKDLLSFVVDLEPENVEAFSELDIQNSGKSSSFLKVLPIFDEIVIPESIFVFHSINCLYFIFREDVEVSSTIGGIKSILKYSGNTRAVRCADKKGITKKVRIFIPDNDAAPVYSSKNTLKNVTEILDNTIHKHTRKNV